MTRRPRRSIDIFNLSFLDVVSCGFGAIVLLLMIVKVAEPLIVERLSVDLTDRMGSLRQEVHRMQTETEQLNRDLSATQDELMLDRERLARLYARLSTFREQQATASSEQQAHAIIEDRLASVRQRLTEEMRRLLGEKYRRPESDATIGGIPVDSEYVIFIVDTSGSMQRAAWPLVLKKLTEVLEIYPRVRGIQVMNDMGDYMFTQYRGRWIPDTPARRRAIIKRLATWQPFSNSSPVEGIEAAIRRFYANDKRISLYVFGDDFARGSIQDVIDTVARLNRANRAAEPRVRIHAVGFPVLYEQGGLPINVVRFAALMRKLAEENNGSFVGLSSLKP